MTRSDLKYIGCECCGFVSAIPEKDEHIDLQCPFCAKAKCDHGGKFDVITKEEFREYCGLD